MKKFFYTLLYFLLSFPLWSKAGEDMRKGIASGWHIIESKPVESLKKNEAIFDFLFRLPAGTNLKKSSIRFSYNGKEKKLVTDSAGHATLKVKPGKYIFQFYYSKEYVEIETDSVTIEPAHETKIEVQFTSAKKPMPMRKPVIYLYPQEPTEVHVQLKTFNPFSFTYPAYNTDSLNPGWKVKAYPDGTLEQEGKKFGYLFWEAPSSIMTHPYIRHGFVVSKNEITSFLEENLTHIGLNTREIQDFITYWAPEMQEHEKVYLYFMFNDEYNLHAKLKITPQPDQLIRLFMLWEPVAPGAITTDIKKQELPHFERKGFTLVEWGGSQINYMMKCWGW